MNASDRLRRYLEEHVGEIIETDRLRDVAGVVSYARRLRELRAQEGMQIASHLDDNSLRPGQYRLASLERLTPVGPASGKQRDLLGAVRVAPREEQLRLYAWLSRKFGPLTDETLAKLLKPGD